MNDSFVFYESFLDAINLLPEEERYPALMNILNYGCKGIEPEKEDLAAVPYILARPVIDSAKENRKNTKKNAEHGKLGAEYGKLGGRPRKEPGVFFTAHGEARLPEPDAEEKETDLASDFTSEYEKEANEKDPLTINRTGTNRKNQNVMNGKNPLEENVMNGKNPLEENVMNGKNPLNVNVNVNDNVNDNVNVNENVNDNVVVNVNVKENVEKVHGDKNVWNDDENTPGKTSPVVFQTTDDDDNFKNLKSFKSFERLQKVENAKSVENTTRSERFQELENLGIALSCSAKKEIQSYLAQGVSDGLVRYAILRAQTYGAKSYSYVRKMLAEYLENRIYTVEAAQGYHEKRAADAKPKTVYQDFYVPKDEIERLKRQNHPKKESDIYVPKDVLEELRRREEEHGRETAAHEDTAF